MPFKSPLFNQAVFLGSLAIVTTGIFNSCNLIFQKNLRYDQSIIATIVGAVATLILGIYYIFTNHPVSYLLLAVFLGWILNNLICLVLVHKLYKFRPIYLSWKFPVNTLKVAWPISLSLILNVVYFRIDSFILGSLYNFAEVGIYNLAYQVFQSALVLPTFIMNSYYPLMIKNLDQGRDYFFSEVRKTGLILLAISLVGLLLTFLLSPFIIQLLGGDEFAGSIISLRILSISFPAFFLSSLLMWVFISLKKLKLMLVIYIGGLVLNSLLNFIFIPQYSYIAASYITGISEYLILIFQIAILWKEFKQK